ncbi:MAG: hypothetical protein KJ852_17930 [Gammaproteobacteria bacterium]|nr:hypothetical protein [Gammaproteobacteria bacterium]MBU0785489.1 hypothetical protein [Gammaproteobacteria bacterium]MBU0813689.1 hypothetical protein [Gammaproteobacteria bacterium]MBU1788839.1 hypothetical protein [Gammaproteobacteria bacterium]
MTRLDLSNKSYRTPPHSRDQLQRLRILSGPAGRYLDETEAAFDAEDRAELAGRAFVQRIREMCASLSNKSKDSP